MKDLVVVFPASANEIIFLLGLIDEHATAIGDCCVCDRMDTGNVERVVGVSLTLVRAYFREHIPSLARERLASGEYSV